MEGIIILVVTLLAFLGIGIYMVVRFVKGPKLPNGLRFEATFGGNKAIVIIDEDLPGLTNKESGKIDSWIVNDHKIVATDIAKKCAIAIHAAELAFKEKGVEKADVDVVVFNFKTSKAFETGNSDWWAEWSKGAAAYSSQLTGLFGSKVMPIAVIRTEFLQMTSERGQPAIHELMHILNKVAVSDYSYNHTDPALWLTAGQADSAEGITIRQWADLVEAFDDGEN